VNYLGQDPNGNHLLDLGDGGPPMAVSPQYLPEGGFGMPPLQPPQQMVAQPEGGYSAPPPPTTAPAPQTPPPAPSPGAMGSNPDGSLMMAPAPAQAAPAPRAKATFYTPPGDAGAAPASTLQPPAVPNLLGGGGGGMGGLAKGILGDAAHQAEAVGQLGEQQAQEGLARQQLFERQNDIAEQRQAAKDELIKQQADDDARRMADYQQKVNEFSSGKIDPNHAWASMGTGNKIAAIIGTALGGLAQGFGIKDNAAAQMIQQHIQNDIRAQEANRENDRFTLGQRKDLVSLAHASGVDKLHQFDLASAAGLDLAAKQVESMAAGFQGQDQKASAQVLASQLRGEAKKSVVGVMAQQQQAANAGAELKLKQYELNQNAYQFKRQIDAQDQSRKLMQAATPGGAGGSAQQGLTDDQANAARAQDPELYGKRLAHLGPNQNILVGSEDERKELEGSISSAGAAADSVQRLIDLRKEHGGLLGGTVGTPLGQLSVNPNAKVADDAANEARLELAGMSKYSRLNPELLKLTGSAIPTHALAGDLTGSTDKALLDELNQLRGHKAAFLKAHGLEEDLDGHLVPLKRGNGG